MSPSKSHLEKEKKTIKTMISMYCKSNHNPRGLFCENCLKLLEYASKRLDYCQFGEDKPTCEQCPIHCYKTEMRENIRKIMRYSGPRMIFSHPFMGIRHLLKKLKKI